MSSILKLSLHQCLNTSQNLYIGSPNQSEVAGNKRGTDTLINIAAASIPRVLLVGKQKLTNGFNGPPKD